DPGGRSLVLGSFPLRAPAGAWSVRPVAGEVVPGGTLAVLVRAEAGTSYVVTALGGVRSGTVDSGGEAELSFAVPEALARGTYSVTYELTFPSAVVERGEEAFDVAGTYLRATSATLDREEALAARGAGGTARAAVAAVAAAVSRVLTYAPGERARLALVLETDTPVTGALSLWLQTRDGLTWDLAADRPLDIAAAEVNQPHVEELTFALPDTGQPGAHRVVYEVSSPAGTILLHGQETLELTGIEPVSVDLELDAYPTATETVRLVADVMLYGSGRIEVWEGETLLASADLTGEGARQALLELPALPPGEHRLRVVFASGTHQEEREVVLVYGTALADLAAALVATAPEYDAQGDVEAGAAALMTVSNVGLSASLAATGVLRVTEPGAPPVELARVAVPPLAAGAAESYSVELSEPVDADIRIYDFAVSPDATALDGSTANDDAQAQLAVPAAPAITASLLDPAQPWRGLSASWSADAGDAAPARYLVALVEIPPGGSERTIVPEQDFAAATSATMDDVPLVIGGTYSLHVRAQNALGIFGRPASSNGVSVPEMPVPLPAALLALALGFMLYRRRRR
ncbi:MAG: hypothetical protein HYV63_28880, partial [Candidatus Schekmanbacteria bacterium]|nr:hypothetical protein [Candidatus Schekmanbacteria bacterium]